MKKYLLLLLIIIIPEFLSGNSIVVHDMNSEYGLPKNRVNCMAQDSKGFLWFGMANGLFKFDLSSFTRFTIQGPNRGFPEVDVRTIVELAPDKLLVGANKGVFVFDTEKETYDTINCSSSIAFSKLMVLSICAFAENGYWLATDQGLIYLRLKDPLVNEFEILSFFNETNSNLNSSQMLEVMSSPEGTIWFISAGDIGFYNPASQNISSFDAYGANSSFMFYNDNVLLSSYGGGVLEFNTTSNSFESIAIDDQLVNAKLRHSYRDRNGKFWFSIANVGLLLMDSLVSGNDELLISNKKDSYSKLNSNVIYKIYESRDGAIWLCTDEGINMITSKPALFKSEIFPSLDDPELEIGVRALISSQNNQIYLGTLGDGLFRYDMESKLNVEIPLIGEEGRTGYFVQCLAEDTLGNIWIGTEGDGVILLKTSEKKKSKPEINYFRAFTNPNPANSLRNDYVMSLLVDAEQNVWIGTWYGLSLIKHSEINQEDMSKVHIQNFLHDKNDSNSLSSSIIMSIIEDSKGTLWIGTNEGLNRLIYTDASYKFESSFKDKTGEPLTNKKILDMCERKNGDIWFSTQDGGICLLHVQTSVFEEFNSSNGFHDNIVNSISLDTTGILWLGTNNGLCRFDPENNTFNTYYTEDQLLSNDFFYRSNCKVENMFILGGNKGITYFNPYEILSSKIDPNLVLTNFRLYNKPVAIDNKSPLKKNISAIDALVLKHNQNYISFEFAALNFNNQKEIHYSCMLEGLESSWNNLRHDRKITYTNLKPGKYLFKVRSFTYGHNTNLAEILLPVTIKPPYWRTTVAYMLYVVFVVFTIYYSYRFFLNKEKKRHSLALERMNAKRRHEMDMLKLQFYTNVSHELRTPLTLISAPLESLMNSDTGIEKTQSYYQLMHKNVQRLRRLITQLLDMRKIEEGHLKMEWSKSDVIEFIKRVFTNFETFAERREIQYSIKCPDTQLDTYFDADKLEKVIFNLLSNAFKYTPDRGSVSLHFEKVEKSGSTNFENGYYLLKIIDTGFGIPSESIRNIYKPFHQVKKNKPIGSAGSGIGLSLTKELIELQNGEISVESEEGKGSVFMVKLPIVQEIPEDSPLSIIKDDSTADDKILEKKTKEEIDQSGSKPIILVVEDDADLRTFICGELEGKYRVLEAANGDEGFKIAVENIPDLVVSDIMMDEMDGVKMCRLLKEDIRTSHIPVILLTARHSEEIKQNSFEIGADDYITKPFIIKLLFTRISNLIEQRRNLRKLFGNGANLDITEIATNKTDVKFLEKLSGCVEENIDNPEFSPNSLASEMAMSKMQLYRKVSALTNQTVYNYIRSIRIIKAAQLLVSTDMQIAEVAYSVGFSEASNFTKTFIKYYNRTPSQYIKEHRI